MEAEFISCFLVAQEVVWLRQFLHNFNVTICAKNLVTIHYDSMAAIAFTKDLKYHERTKHINMQNSFIRDLIAYKK